MAKWNIIDTDFGGDETGHFGPRLETGTALYQIDTTATISTKEKVLNNPTVGASVVEETVAVTAGNQLSLFEDSCHRHLVTLTFESEIDCLACTEDGNFVALGERNGKFHFIDIQEQKHLISLPLVKATDEGQSFKQILFTPPTPNGVCECLVLSAEGIVTIFKKLQLTKLHEALLVKDVELLKKLRGEMSNVRINTADFHTGGASCIAVSPTNGIDTVITGGQGEAMLCVWERGQEAYDPIDIISSMFTKDEEVVKCVISNCGTYLLTLDNKLLLSLWSLHTMTMLLQWTETQVVDFLVLEAADTDSSVGGMKLVMITDVLEGFCALKVCNLPDLDPVYTIQLCEQTVLAKCQTHQEALFFVEGVHENDNSISGEESLISSLRVRCLTEALPETRFNRILYKKQFDEAETFAKTFGLNVQLVYRVKANHLLDILSSWNVTKLSLTEVENFSAQLQATLKLINDDGHVVDCCVKACLPNFDATLELLNYARKRLEDHMTTANGRQENGEAEIDRPALLTWVLSTLHKLATFQVAFGISKFSGTRWDEFVQANLLPEFLKWLCQGKTTTAFTIWNRHQAEFEEVFSIKTLETILSSVPESILTDELKPWLSQTFIPFVIRHLPEGLNMVAAWIEQRTRNMEVLEKDGWPQNALQFAEILQHTCVSIAELSTERELATPEEFATQACNLSVGFTQVNGNQTGVLTDSFVRLHVLITQLRDLLSLHTNYNCKLSLAEYSQESTETLTFRMLDRVVALVLISSTVEKVVRPYMKEHNLNEEKMLYKYIGDLAQRSAKITSVVGEAPWEAKAIAIISCIQDEEYKCLAIQDAMQRAHIPWSTDMEDLVNQGLALKHPRVADLVEQCKLMDLRKLLTSYGLRNFNVAETTSAETVVYYVLKQDRPTAVKDALEIVHFKAFSYLTDDMAYMFRLCFLIEKNRWPEGIELLKSLPKEKACSCGQRIVITAQLKLEDSLILDMETYLKERLLYAEAACDCIKFMSRLNVLDADSKEDNLATLEELQSIIVLQIEFGEVVSHASYLGVMVRESLMKKHLTAFYSNKSAQVGTGNTSDPDRKPSKMSGKCFTKIYRLASILKISREELRGRLALEAAKSGKAPLAIKLAGEMYSNPCPETGDVLYQVAHALCDWMRSGGYKSSGMEASQLSQDIHRLASQALTCCSPAVLSDCLELCKGTSMAESVISQSETGDYGTAIKNVSEAINTDGFSKDMVKEFCHYFKEDGLVMESEVVAPLVYSYALACLPNTDPLSSPYTVNRLAGKSCLEEMKNDQKTPPLASLMAQLGQTALELMEYLKENSQMTLALNYTADTVATFLQFQAAQSMGFPIESLELKERLARVYEHTNVVSNAGVKNINDLCAILLKKVYTQGRIDHHLALGYICALPKNTALVCLNKTTNSAGNQFKKVMALTRIGADFAELIKEEAIKETCLNMEANAIWGHKLSKLKIPFGGFMKKTSDAKRNLLEDIVQNPNINILLIQDYCRTFKIDEDEALFLYLNQLLVPKVAPSKGLHSNLSSVLAKARNTIQVIDHSDKLLDNLTNILHKLDMYDYERLAFVLQEINTIDSTPLTEKGLKLLDYVTKYKRNCPPSEYELNYKPLTEEEQIRGGGVCFTDTTLNRLPFHPMLMGDHWKILAPELNAETVKTWIPVAPLLKLPVDQVYVTAIQNIVTSHIKAHKQVSGEQGASAMDKSKCNWSEEDGVDMDLFKAVEKLLFQVTDGELAMSCASWIVKELPMGAEKVLALQFCVSLARRWYESCSNNSPEKQKAKEACAKFTEICRILSTEQVLYKHKLGEADLLSVTSSPSRLIFRLYEHESILRRPLGAVKVDNLPDIHMVTEKISKINSVNVAKIRLNLVEKWLPAAQPKDDLNETTFIHTSNFNINFNEMDTSIKAEELNEDEINLKRVTYLLQHGDITKNAKFLYNYAYNNPTDATKITYMCRLRALRILFSLVDKDTIEKNSCHSLPEIKEYMQNLLYLVELDFLHSPLNIESFKKCNKDGLVRGIWRNHSTEKRAVRLVADLSLDYEIYDVQLWNSVLKQLKAFQMTEYLRHVLVCLSGVPDLWQVPCIQHMWRTILLHPLTSAVPPLSDAQIDECLQSYTLLHRCPLLLDMDLQNMARHYQRLELGVFAMGCLLLMPSGSNVKGQGDGSATQVESLVAKVTKILGTTSVVTVLDQLHDWRQAGKNIPLAEQIQEALYLHANYNQIFETMRTSRYFEDFVSVLIRKDQIDNLLIQAIRADKLPQAIQLVEAYYSNQKSRYSTTNIPPMKKLKNYLKQKGYEELIHQFLLSSESTMEDSQCRSNDSSQFSLLV